MSASLADLVWPDVERERVGPVLVVPLGATEQHGPHLPLSTDTDIALALAEALRRRRDDIIVAPAIPYGSSGEHSDFGGTLSIGREATEQLVLELGRSATATFSRVLLLSVHGGNTHPVARAVRRLRQEGRDVHAYFPTWSSDAHAGRAETSIMLELAPKRVRLERAEAGATEPLAHLLPRLIAEGVRAVSDNGVLGDPTAASASEGRELLARAGDELVSLVERWEAST